MQIPPQKLANGHVIFKVLEAKLGTVKMRAEPDARVNADFTKGYVTVNNPPGEYIDANSVEMLMGLIHEFSDDTNVFVISHKGDQLFEKFRSVIKFEKHKNFSRIAA